MRLRSTLFALLVLSGSCSRKLEGPRPTLSEASPAAVCQAQLDTPVTLTGSGLSPLVTGALSDSPVLNLPQISLTRSQDLSGASAPWTVELPDDPADPSSSYLRWTSQEQMSFHVDPELSLPAGLYDIQVANPNGASGSLMAGLLAVPPPVVTQLSQDIACGAKPNTLTVTGDFFIRKVDAAPAVTIGASSFVPDSAGGCRALPGGAGLEACTFLPLSLGAGALAPGRYPVSVTNPSPVGCTSAAGPALTLFDKPTVTQVAPVAVCSEATSTPLVITGTGFLAVDGANPAVTIGASTFASTPDGCVAIDGTLEPVQQCTNLTITVPANTFIPGSYPLLVTNPPPVDCASSDVFELRVSPPPTITSIQPTAVCAGGAALTITGTGLQDGARVTMNGVDAALVTSAVGGTSAVARFPTGLALGGPFAVTFANPDGCEVTSAATINVIPGPQIFFVDPSVVYNGIAVQGTVYGTGFTGAVAAVSISPTDGGTALPLDFTYDALRPNQVQVVLPKSTPPLAPGEYDVQLNDSTGCPARLARGVKVVDQLTLALATPPVVPEFGWVSENTAVTIFANTTAGGGFAAVPRLYLNPANPGPATVATAIGAVTFVDPGKVTALIPTPKLPAGSYDLIAVNPDGTVGHAANAFRVTALPPPTIESLAPGSVANTNPQTFEVNGKDFRSPTVTLSCVDATGAALAVSPLANVTSSSATKVAVSFDASAAGVACVVRVTDGDNQTFADFSALVITNPAQNLYAATFGPDLKTARRATVALGGNATSAARYLHVIGGDDGTGGAAFDSVESSALSLLGVPSTFGVQRTRLATARAFAAGANLGRFLYVAGGSSGGAALDSVERAAVLDPALRGEVTDLLLEVDTARGLGTGVWYYRVASVMAASDPFNPLGENLASDPFPVQLPDLGSTRFVVTVSWKADPGAAKYRVYRSATAGATVGTEEVIGEVAAGTTSFKDTGLTPISTDRPLPVGSLGTWQTLAARLSVPREGAAVAVALNPADPAKAHLYVLGGRQNGTTALASFEFLTLTLGADGSQTPGAAFTAGSAALSAARWQLGAATGTHELSSRIPAGTSYVYVLSGVTAGGGSMVSNCEAGLVESSGQLTFSTISASTQQAGYTAVVAGNLVFAFGGSNATPDNKIISGPICTGTVTGCGTKVPPEVKNLNAGQQMNSNRYLHGGTLSGAFMYMVGGVSIAGAPPTVSATTEYRLW